MSEGLIVTLGLKDAGVNKQITAINKELRYLDKEFKTANKSSKDFENSSEGLKNKLTVDFDIFNKKLIFKIYKGIDRSVDQKVVAPVIFSREFENIFSQNYIESSNNLKNVALVDAVGEGMERKLIIVGNENGLDRYEIFVDARDISDIRSMESEDVTINEETKELCGTVHEVDTTDIFNTYQNYLNEKINSNEFDEWFNG